MYDVFFMCRSEMMKSVAHYKSQVRGKYPTRVSSYFANYLARHEVGCEYVIHDLFLYFFDEFYLCFCYFL